MGFVLNSVHPPRTPHTLPTNLADTPMMSLEQAYAEHLARKLGARRALHDDLVAEEGEVLGSSTLTRVPAVHRTAIGRAISMRVRMAEMELKRRGRGAGRGAEESMAEAEESSRGQVFADYD